MGEGPVQRSNAPAHLRAPCKRNDTSLGRGSTEDGTVRGLPVRCSATLDGELGSAALACAQQQYTALLAELRLP